MCLKMLPLFMQTHTRSCIHSHGKTQTLKCTQRCQGIDLHRSANLEHILHLNEKIQIVEIIS